MASFGHQGVPAGIDMVSTYTQQNQNFNKKLVDFSLRLMDFVLEARGVDYA